MPQASHACKRVGMLGGAFDPPHHAHVALAEAALAQLQLDCLHVIPTGQAWHKARPLSDAAHRLAMCELAFADLGPVRVDARETLREGPTYTVDTLRELHALYPLAEIFLVMGADQARALPQWHRAEDLASLAIICVAERDEWGAHTVQPEIAGLSPARLRWLHMPPSPLSATTVRHQLAQQQSVETLVPAAVARYIDHNHLYQASR